MTDSTPKSYSLEDRLERMTENGMFGEVFLPQEQKIVFQAYFVVKSLRQTGANQCYELDENLLREFNRLVRELEDLQSRNTP
jgi:hypothetical protein